MYQPNVDKILGTLSPTDKVLDVGGWACPFNRANYVMDAEAYETRGFYKTFGGPAFQGGEEEHFSAETWIQRDVCDREPYPFADDELDFAICSHTLEDLRDPIWVCSELTRIAKRGYIEVPSRELESCRGWYHPKVVGLPHHRWLVDIEGDGVCFQQKYHMIHAHWRFALPHGHLKRMPESRHNQWLFWEGGFDFEEKTLHGLEAIEEELEGFVQSIRPYPAWRLAVAGGLRRVGYLQRRVRGKIGRMMRGS